MEQTISNSNCLKDKNLHKPQRMCVACRKMTDKSQLFRIIKDNTEKWQLDKTGKAQRRGVYICRDIECLQLAVKNKRLVKQYGNQFIELLKDIVKEVSNEHK